MFISNTKLSSSINKFAKDKAQASDKRERVQKNCERS